MKTWDDPIYKEKPKKVKKKVIPEKRILICSHCGKPYARTEKDYCECSIWDIGKS